MNEISFTLRPLAPFRLDLTAWVLRRRAINAVDRWIDEAWQRVVMIDDEPVHVAVRQTGGVETPRVQVRARAAHLSPSVRVRLKAVITRMLGLRVDLSAFYQLASRDRRLTALAVQFRGFKPPRFASLFETLVNGVSCQQISLTVGITLLNRLTVACGPAIAGDESFRAFPGPREVDSLRVEKLRAMGYSTSKAIAIKGLAEKMLAGELDTTVLERMPDEAAIETLQTLRGVGRWTAEYALLRALGRIQIFPGDDSGALNRLRQWLKLDEPLDHAKVNELLARWNPFAGLIYFHMLLYGLSLDKAQTE